MRQSVGTSPPPQPAPEVPEKMEIGEDAPQAQAPADVEGDDINQLAVFVLKEVKGLSQDLREAALRSVYGLPPSQPKKK